MFSQTYVGIIVMLLSVLLPKIGVNLGSDELTAFISTLLVIGGGLYAFIGRYRAGGINRLGFKQPQAGANPQN